MSEGQGSLGPQLTPVRPQRDHLRGPQDAPVTVIEYGDYECPFCVVAHRDGKTIWRRFGNKVCFVWRHYPIPELHPHARHAAEAAEAAGEQGHYWEMHDLLLDNQGALERDDLVGYARRLNLDENAFAEDLDAGRHSERIDEDLRSGIEAGVNSTPKFFVNGAPLTGRTPVEHLVDVLEAALAGSG